jgi:hypothetical protein
VILHFAGNKALADCDIGSLAIRTRWTGKSPVEYRFGKLEGQARPLAGHLAGMIWLYRRKHRRKR